ncbi:unnamed protein product, partial [Nesidiocoris tenuis]
IDWKDKLYLAPLTTLGNLPFRRICKEYGADVTCGEMALASSLLRGDASEWSLVKRHSSEDLYGVQIHGRSREQRYTKNADWDYVEECAKKVFPVPVFGNGDVLSYEDYARVRDQCPTVQGVMIGRGALMKPWIFQEIKEKRIMDPSSSERLDMLRRFTNYGLDHWGSDNRVSQFCDLLH